MVKKAEPQNNDRKVALETAMQQLKKKYGSGSVMMMDDESVQNVDSISTGSIALDTALGVGGLPKGRIIEIFGPESSGKSTLALHCVAEAQRAGGTAAYIDVEHAMDAEYAKNVGVNVNETIISQPGSAEEALDIAEALIRSGGIDIIVIDSVAALVPLAELEGSMEDQQMGLQARIMSKALRKLTAAVNEANVVCVFINQLRSKIGIMFGNPEVTAGGNALKYYASVRLDIRRTESIKVGSDVIGNHVKVKVVKNKVAPPFRVAEFDIVFGKGIDSAAEVLDIGTAQGLIEKSGSFYSYQGERIGQGRDKSKQFLIDHPDVFDELKDKIIAGYRSPEAEPDSNEED